MQPNHPNGYEGRMLRVNLSEGKTSEEVPGEATLRQYLGGTGLGIKYLYEEVPPSIRWHDPENRLILASGPLGGTTMAGSGTYSVVTKGAMTEGASSSQANGLFGAYLRLSGFDGVILHGASPCWCYIYIHDGIAELRDADHLIGRDTLQTEELVKRELGGPERSLSVITIGPAGEKMVRFAAIVGDRGHVAAHNGVGAVMGSKKVKAIAVRRGSHPIRINNRGRLSAAAEDIFRRLTSEPGYYAHTDGTLGAKGRGKARLVSALLPCKNYTTNLFPQGAVIEANIFRSRSEVTNHPCWACRFQHCYLYKIKEGRYAGYEAEEPEYESAAAMGPLIGVGDPDAMVVLSDQVDRLGMDVNEAGWTIAWMIECCEKGVLGSNDLNGIEMKWGDVEATSAMLKNIAERSGIGDVLAEGVMRASQELAQQAGNLAIFTKKGNTPRTHDHRSSWTMLLDTCTSDATTSEGAANWLANKVAFGFSPNADVFSPEIVALAVARWRGKWPFIDSLGVCNRHVPVISIYKDCSELISAVTGWDYTEEEATSTGRRIANLLRAFNVRHGLGAELDWPSRRYASAPLDGPFQGRSALPVWEKMLRNYYDNLGWDNSSGAPLPETLSSLGLDRVIKDIWP